jgi:hypothetical protein
MLFKNTRRPTHPHRSASALPLLIGLLLGATAGLGSLQPAAAQDVPSWAAPQDHRQQDAFQERRSYERDHQRRAPQQTNPGNVGQYRDDWQDAGVGGPTTNMGGNGRGNGPGANPGQCKKKMMATPECTELCRENPDNANCETYFENTSASVPLSGVWLLALMGVGYGAFRLR